MTDELDNEICYRDELNRLRKRPGLSANDKRVRDSIYKTQRNRVTNIGRRTRQQFVARMMEEAVGDKRKSWRLVNGILNNKFHATGPELPPIVRTRTSDVVVDPIQVADTLCNFFTGVSR